MDGGYAVILRDMDNLVISSVDGRGVAILRVNRPEARNALNEAAQDQFAASVAAVKDNEQVRVVIITGTGEKSFVSGGDLKEHFGDHGPSVGKHLNRVMSRALADLRRLPVPVIAAINGDAFGGGCEIMTACDLRIARAGARFGFAQVRTGLTTGWGGGGRLVQLIGLSRACELLLSGRVFDAQEALAIGLVQRLVKTDEDVLAAAQVWAGELIELPAQAMAAIKRMVGAAATLPADEAAELEAQLFLSCWGSPDHLEALAAFSEKRRARFNQPREI